MQVEGVLDRADHVVAAVHDHPGDPRDPVRVAQQLVLDLEEPTVDEVVVLDPGERQRGLGLGLVFTELSDARGDGNFHYEYVELYVD